MSVDLLYEILFAALALSLLASFCYMVGKRGVLSAFLWTFAPLRYWLSSFSDTPYDDNPEWLDRIQWGVMAAIGLLWLATKAKLIS